MEQQIWKSYFLIFYLKPGVTGDTPSQIITSFVELVRQSHTEENKFSASQITNKIHKVLWNLLYRMLHWSDYPSQLSDNRWWYNIQINWKMNPPKKLRHFRAMNMNAYPENWTRSYDSQKQIISRDGKKPWLDLAQCGNWRIDFT